MSTDYDCSKIENYEKLRKLQLFQNFYQSETSF